MENKSNRLNHDDRKKTERPDNGTRFSILTDVDNKINIDADNFNLYDGNFNNVFRRKKFGKHTIISFESEIFFLISCLLLIGQASLSLWVDGVVWKLLNIILFISQVVVPKWQMKTQLSRVSAEGHTILLKI